MNLTAETSIVTLAIGALFALPLTSARVRSHSGVLILTGTGAMLGICAFDLVPDVYEMGGLPGVVATLGIWAVYSVLHFFHLDHHHVEDHEGAIVRPSPFFFVSIIGHCFASGMLLAVSRAYSGALTANVFAALLVHKAYEALTVASLLVAGRESRSIRAAIVGAYVLSFPAGVSATLALGNVVGQKVALGISSIAVGTLLGCLMFDFLLPSMAHIRRRRSHIAWIAIGLIVTQLIMLKLGT